MTNKPLAIIIATKPSPHVEHVQAQGERWLLEEYNCTLMNNIARLKRSTTSQAWLKNFAEFSDAKHILPIWDYEESRPHAGETLKHFNYHIESDHTPYIYVRDEAGTSGPVEERAGNYHRMKQEIEDVRDFLDITANILVTHPFPVDCVPESDWETTMDVAAWRLSLMEQHMAEYADRLAQVPELWAYLINTDFEQAFNALPNDPEWHDSSSAADVKQWARGIGPRVRAVGATTLLINDVSLLKYLFNATTRRPTDVGLALLEGVRDA